MTVSSQATTDRRYAMSQPRDTNLYKIGWLVGLAIGALTLLYRCAG